MNIIVDTITEIIDAYVEIIPFCTISAISIFNGVIKK